MAGSQRDRRKMTGQARRAAAAKARRRGKQRRRVMIGGVCGLVVVAVVLGVWRPWSDDSKDVQTTSATTVPGPTTTVPGGATTTVPSAEAAADSAAGKPCVPVADPLPPNAPAVPVKDGPPPVSLVTEDLKVGDGATVEPGATVTVNYIGVSCSTGKIFDSSWSRNQPATFPLDQVIDGWKQGIPGMKVGGQRLLGIPPELAYGAQGRPPEISPNETLWFVVDAVDNKATVQPPTRAPRG